MGAADFIIGMTVQSEIVRGLSDDLIHTAIQIHRDEIVKNLPVIDESGYIHVMADSPEDEAPTLIYNLVEALSWLRDVPEDSVLFPIGSGEDRQFLVAGGEDPINQFDALILLAKTAEVVPFFGRSVGVFGGGIILT